MPFYMKNNLNLLIYAHWVGKNNTDIDAKLFTLVKCLLDSDNNSFIRGNVCSALK